MKVLVVPDIHGAWKNIIPYIKEHKDLVDKVVTLGDYVDDWDESLNGAPMISGFSTLVKMARAEPDKFCICIGNHDHSYITNQSCSGHHFQYAPDYYKMFTDNLDIMHAAVLLDNVLFSHAGVSLDWYHSLLRTYNVAHEKDFVPKELKDELNKWLYEDKNINTLYFDGRIFSLVTARTPEEQKDIDDYRAIQTNIREHINDCCKRMESYYKDTIKSTSFSVETLDKIFHEKPAFLESIGWSPSGDSRGECCLWIRPRSLLGDSWPRVKCQVVGHTELGLMQITHNRHKLIICDNHEHDCAFILDTKKLGNFEKI